MPEHAGQPHGVMEGSGAYNQHAKLPAGGAALALPLLEEAVREFTPELGDRQVVIADYGSSQGKNSFAPIQLAIKILRPRIGPSRPIVVYHIDQPTNDFNSLFEVLANDPDRYTVNEPDVFPCAIGRSFYEQVLPPESVHLGWCSYAAVWLSRIPALIPGHFISIRSTGPVRAVFERQAAVDWEHFLSLRACELIPGGRLVVVLPALADDGTSGYEWIMDHANDTLAEMVDDGAITGDERARMVLQSHPRRKSDLLAPFAEENRFRGLTVQNLDVSRLADGAWARYERDGDRDAFATQHALFFRTIFMPTLATALTRVRAGDTEAHSVFAERFELGLKRRLARDPAAMDTLVQTIVLAKYCSD
jgi:hypothetical protein